MARIRRNAAGQNRTVISTQMASTTTPLQILVPPSPVRSYAFPCSAVALRCAQPACFGVSFSRDVSVSAVGEVSADGNAYLFAGAAAMALIGTSFPILFFRKDKCPECDGAGFVREAGASLRANAARKDLPQIVCPRCNGLGKLGQIDK